MNLKNLTRYVALIPPEADISSSPKPTIVPLPGSLYFSIYRGFWARVWCLSYAPNKQLKFTFNVAAGLPVCLVPFPFYSRTQGIGFIWLLLGFMLEWGE